MSEFSKDDRCIDMLGRGLIVLPIDRTTKPFGSRRAVTDLQSNVAAFQTLNRAKPAAGGCVAIARTDREHYAAGRWHDLWRGLG